ncbi:MAG TPA: NRDE family protein [Anaeromyxobacteraceae bacterium]|nr:NRDE family protein [Anaeromyxobacteraceae bacterium]
MCTLAVAWRTDRRWPIVVAANRDERLRRAAEPWGLREHGLGPRYAAPLDRVGGGTWIGVSARGVFAGLTNHHATEGGFPDPRRRSRGEIVVQALGHARAAEARAAFAVADAARYNPFHLLVADAEAAFLWLYDGAETALIDLGPGLHVVTEQDAEGRGARGDFVRSRWPIDSDLARLRELLAHHAPSPREAVCIHLDERDYGTRSSSVIRLAPSLQASELWVSEGRPCTTPFDDRSQLLADLARKGL